MCESHVQQKKRKKKVEEEELHALTKHLYTYGIHVQMIPLYSSIKRQIISEEISNSADVQYVTEHKIISPSFQI